MARTRSGLTLGAKLLLMVVAALVPAFVVIFHHNGAQKRAALENAYAELTAVADLVAAVQRRTAEGTRQLLVAVAKAPEVLGADGAKCGRYLAQIKAQFDRYANLGVIDAGGRLRCSALPFDGTIRLDDREYFRAALDRGGFAVGGYQVGRATRIASVNFGLPVLDERGRAVGVAFAALDLQALGRLGAPPRLSAGTELEVTDANGTILFALPARAGRVGVRDFLAAGEPIERAGYPGLERIRGEQGLERIRATVAIEDFAAGRLLVRASRPVDTLLGPIERDLATQLFGLSLFSLAMGFVAWSVGSRSIKDPLDELARLARRVAAGDLTARAERGTRFDEVGRLAGAISEMVDKLAGQRKAHDRQREELRAGEARLAEAQRIAHLGSWEFDLRADHLSWSDETYRIFGLRKTEFGATYEAFLACVHPGDRARMQAAQDEALAGRAPLDLEHRIVTPEGVVKEVHEVAELVRDAQGRPLRLAGTVLDVTERRRAERTTELLAAIVESSEDAIWSRDLEGTVLTWNAGAERLFGWRREEIVGRSDAYLVPPDRRAERDAQMREQARTGRPVSFETVRLRKDGSWVEVEARLSAIRDPAGAVTGYAVIMHDISERRRAARELEETGVRLHYLSGRLLDAQEAERKAIAMELHDEIGQALSAIKLNLKFVLRLVDDPAAREKLESTVRVTDTVLGQVRNLSLDLRPPQLDLMGLAPAIRAALEKSAAAAGIAVAIDASLEEGPRDPHAEIACFRVAQEAMTNVIRHARASKVRVELVERGGVIRLKVRDDGVGFSPGEATAAANLGLSMGLQGMRERTILAGGEFEVRTAPGEGTEIRASFPLARRTAPEAEAAR